MQEAVNESLTHIAKAKELALNSLTDDDENWVTTMSELIGLLEKTLELLSRI
jgi:hypothetical protein